MPTGYQLHRFKWTFLDERASAGGRGSARIAPPDSMLFDAADDPLRAVASYQRYLRLNPWDERARKRMEWLRGENR